ncbi:MAG: molybdenum cofactor guanylyltransferase [Bacteroidales bacterium]
MNKDGQKMHKYNASAVILAGGKGSRMGGADKGMLDRKGEPIIAYIRRQLEDDFEEIIVGANDNEKYRFLNCRVVPDLEAGKGPLMGIYSCLLASQNEVNFVTACDIPEMNPGLIREMISLSISTSADIVMPVSKGDKYEPLYAVYRRSVTGAIKKLLGNDQRRIIDLFAHTRVKLVDFDHGQWYHNLNRHSAYLDYLKKVGG